eukprot:gene24980-biopygen17963
MRRRRRRKGRTTWEHAAPQAPSLENNNNHEPALVKHLRPLKRWFEESKNFLRDFRRDFFPRTPCMRRAYGLNKSETLAFVAVRSKMVSRQENERSIAVTSFTSLRVVLLRPRPASHQITDYSHGKRNDRAGLGLHPRLSGLIQSTFCTAVCCKLTNVNARLQDVARRQSTCSVDFLSCLSFLGKWPSQHRLSTCHRRVRRCLLGISFVLSSPSLEVA